MLWCKKDKYIHNDYRNMAMSANPMKLNEQRNQSGESNGGDEKIPLTIIIAG